MCARREAGVGLIGRDESGATAVEFALVSPLLILLFVGFIQLGWILHCASSVRWALEASSRSLLIKPDQSADQLRSAMVRKLSGLADTSDLEVTVTPNAAAQTVVVESLYEARLSLPLLPAETLTFRNAVTVPVFD